MEIIDLQSQDIRKNAFKESLLFCNAEVILQFSKMKNKAAKYYYMFGSTSMCNQVFHNKHA